MRDRLVRVARMATPVLALLVLAGCRNPYGWLSGDKPVKLIPDTAEVRGYVAKQVPTDYPHVPEFLAAMDAAPGVTLPPKTYVALLNPSKIPCSVEKNEVTRKQVWGLVRVSVGTAKDNIGWVCLNRDVMPTTPIH